MNELTNQVVNDVQCWHLSSVLSPHYKHNFTMKRKNYMVNTKEIPNDDPPKIRMIFVCRGSVVDVQCTLYMWTARARVQCAFYSVFLLGFPVYCEGVFFIVTHKLANCGEKSHQKPGSGFVINNALTIKKLSLSVRFVASVRKKLNGNKSKK